MTHQAPNPGDPAYDLSDPHGFHKDAEGHDAHHQHHVSSWQLMVAVLAALLFFTVLTVVVAQGESFISTELGIPITQLWNVIIAMSIATVKAMLVCMYFMHLRHDNPLNTFVLLFTIATLGLFLLFPSIDTGSRGTLNPIKAQVLVEGGTGVGVTRPDGSAINGPIVYEARARKIAAVAAYYAEKNGHAEPSEADLSEAGKDIWFHYYTQVAAHGHGKPLQRAKDDTQDFMAMWEAEGRPDRHEPTTKHKAAAHADDHGHGGHHGPAKRTGLTPGLFDEHAPAHPAPGHGAGHGDAPGDGHEPADDAGHSDAAPAHGEH